LSGERSLCNSAAVLRHAKAQNVRADWVRPGIALYGSAPDFPLHTASEWQLQPVMSLNAAIVGVQHLQPGDTVGYGSSFVADRAMRIGVVSCGYADGYPRSAPTGTPVCVDGVRTHTVGRVSMDMITVDLTPLPQAGLGSEVTLWGLPQKTKAGAMEVAGAAGVSIDEVAMAAGTVGYELMCALSPRVPVNTSS
jgi:alanine racemase